MEIKTREEYNEMWNFLGWLARKPEYGGPKKFDRGKYDSVWEAIEEYDRKALNQASLGG